MSRLNKIFLKKLYWYVVLLWFIGFLSSTIILYICNKFHIATNDYGFQPGQNLLPVLVHLPLWALNEELVFRFLPFFLIFSIKYEFSNKQIWLIMIFISCLFGYIHGSFRAIFVQGTMGLYFALIFWRYSFRIKNIKCMINGLIASTIVHFSYNSYVIVLDHFSQNSPR